MASTDFHKHALQELFEQIMSISRKMQYQLLAEHGCIGKLPFIATDDLGTKQARVVFQGAEGAYSQEIYDLLTEFENYIVGEQIIKIEHCLMAVPGTKIGDIKTVYSHPQSLMQSSNYLSKTGWQQISMKNNAFAAQKVKEDGLFNQAAIASEVAAEIYGLEILQKGVNNLKDNSTRFIIVTNQKGNSSDKSLCMRKIMLT